MTNRKIILEDKWLPSGSSKIFDQEYKEIGTIHYSFFNLRSKIEIKDHEGIVKSIGKAKLLSFMPSWFIEDGKGEKTLGQIKRKFTFFKKRYEYRDQDNKLYQIQGSVFDRKFQIQDENNVVVVNITNLSSIISLKQYTFMIELEEDEMDIWEAIQVVQGVRSLAKKEDDDRSNNHR